MDDLREKYLTLIAAAADETVLEELRVQAVGKKGEISLHMAHQRAGTDLACGQNMLAARCDARIKAALIMAIGLRSIDGACL